MGGLRVLLVCVGLLFVVFGTAAAAFVGPDDTIMIGEKQVPERAKGVAVRTHPEITDFVNIDLLVRAEAEGGIFLGSSHRVDTESLLSGTRYFEVTRLALGNVGGVVTDGPRATRKRLRPNSLVGWQQQVTDAESAELVVELDGRPVDVVAVPQRGNARVTVAIGAHAGGAFLTQVAVAVVGVLLIVGSWLLGRVAGRRGKGGAPSGGSPGPSSGDAAAEPPAPLALPKYPDDRTSTPLHLVPSDALLDAPVVDRPRALALVRDPGPEAGAAPEQPLALRGTALPAAVRTLVRTPAPAPEVESFAAPALAAVEEPVVEPVVEAVVEPVERATVRTPPSPTPAWSLRKIVVVMVLLPVTLVLTSCGVPGPAPTQPEGEEVTRTGMTIREARTLVPEASAAFAPEFASYPMWSLVGMTSPTRVRLMSRESFRSPWVAEARVRLRGDLPATVERVIPANTILQGRADEYAAKVGAFWSSGDAAGLDLDRRTKRARARLLESGVSSSGIWVLPAVDVATARLVEVSGGHLVVLRHTVMTPAPHRLTTVVDFPSAARPRVLGSSLVAVD
ncbi:hypothetical protein [Nocardioides daphniae]|uniref:Uncharacterized protein n=1 Tax=Nocardioides daphniae TaxID=402297 RepID=A0A4P7U8C2_9ACTN|nr:hypothetical protein [Nocardioides daphniae]QCC76423.1 hypothetical protein E2C04_02910 [Nocardioides daphniae]GGD06857.1 hypothetical protein GCM10007231_02050 [Nocardioides daphniae]